MLIRSQTKAILINFTNITYLTLDVDTVNNKCRIRACYMERNIVILGTYSSSEKANKVLDMIQEFYNDTMHYQSAHYVSPPNLVFQMPQEEEVCLTD